MQLIQGPASQALSRTQGVQSPSQQQASRPAAGGSKQGRIVLDKVDLSTLAKKLLEDAADTGNSQSAAAAQPHTRTAAAGIGHDGDGDGA